MVSPARHLILQAAGLLLALAAAPHLLGAEAERSVSMVRPAPGAARRTLALSAAQARPAAGSSEAREARQELPAGTWGQVSGDQVNVRSGPGTAFEAVVILRGGDFVRVVARCGSWIEIEWPEAVPAWVAKELLGPEGVISAERVRIRASGNLNAPILREGKRGERLEVLGEAGAWYKVKAPAGARAYLHGKYAVLGVRPPMGSALPEYRGTVAEVRSQGAVAPVGSREASAAVAAVPERSALTIKTPAEPEKESAPAGEAGKVHARSVGNAAPVIESPLLASATLEPERKPNPVLAAPGAQNIESSPARAMEIPCALTPASTTPTVSVAPALQPTPAQSTPALPSFLVVRPDPPVVAALPPPPVVKPELPAEAPASARPAQVLTSAPPGKSAAAKDSYGELLPPPSDAQAGEGVTSTGIPSSTLQRNPSRSVHPEVREGSLLYKTRDAFAMAGRMLAHSPAKIAETANTALAAVKSKLGNRKPHEQAAGPDPVSAAAPAASSLPSVSQVPSKGAPGVGPAVPSRAAAEQAPAGPAPEVAPAPSARASETSKPSTPETAKPLSGADGAKLPLPLGVAPRAERLPVQRVSQLRMVEQAPIVTADGLLESATSTQLAEANHRLLKDGATIYELQADPGLGLDDYLGRRVEVVGTRSNLLEERGHRVLSVIRVRELE